MIPSIISALTQIIMYIVIELFEKISEAATMYS